MEHRYKLMLIMFSAVFLLFSAVITFAQDCDDYELIDYYAVGGYSWTHSMPPGCSAASAEIEIVINVWTFNDYGTLDLFSSNTSTFDYGSVTTAPSKPGFIERLSRTDCPDPEQYYTLRFSLDSTQRSWLNDDGTIYIALIGVEYWWPGWPAQFDLTSSTLLVDGGSTEPTISQSPMSLSNSCPEGTDASDLSFEVWNSGGGTLSYSISDDAAWLSCAPTNGSSSGEHDTISVSFASSSLSTGNYSATITITDSSASNSPQTIPVSLTVEESTCSDNDEDGSGDPGDPSCPAGSERDCDDTNEFIYPTNPNTNCDCAEPISEGETESVADGNCEDGEDNDCDGYSDCGDHDCNGAPNCGHTASTIPTRLHRASDIQKSRLTNYLAFYVFIPLVGFFLVRGIFRRR